MLPCVVFKKPILSLTYSRVTRFEIDIFSFNSFLRSKQANIKKTQIKGITRGVSAFQTITITPLRSKTVGQR